MQRQCDQFYAPRLSIFVHEWVFVFCSDYAPRGASWNPEFSTSANIGAIYDFSKTKMPQRPRPPRTFRADGKTSFLPASFWPSSRLLPHVFTHFWYLNDYAQARHAIILFHAHFAWSTRTRRFFLQKFLLWRKRSRTLNTNNTELRVINFSMWKINKFTCIYLRKPFFFSSWCFFPLHSNRRGNSFRNLPFWRIWNDARDVESLKISGQNCSRPFLKGTNCRYRFLSGSSRSLFARFSMTFIG